MLPRIDKSDPIKGTEKEPWNWSGGDNDSWGTKNRKETWGWRFYHKGEGSCLSLKKIFDNKQFLTFPIYICKRLKMLMYVSWKETKQCTIKKNYHLLSSPPNISSFFYQGCKGVISIYKSHSINKVNFA